jgi:oxygen-dependent protoporphyrinogen oxidase
VIEDFQRRGGSLVLNAPVRELSRAADGWTLTVGATTDATAVTADVVVLATPAGPTARLLRKVAPRVSGELADIDYASVAIITLAVPAAAVPSEVTGTGFLVPPVDGLPGIVAASPEFVPTSTQFRDSSCAALPTTEWVFLRWSLGERRVRPG